MTVGSPPESCSRRAVANARHYSPIVARLAKPTATHTRAKGRGNLTVES